MSFVQEILGSLGILVIAGIYDWISTVNSRMQSYAERVWGHFALFMLVVAIILFWVVSQNLFVSIDKVFAGLVSGLICLGLSYFSYQIWQQSLNEESD